jgi:hypothetical protein
LVLSSDFCIVRLCRPVLSNKTNAVKMVGNWLADPSKMDFVEAFMEGPVLSKLFVRYNKHACAFQCRPGALLQPGHI